MLMNVLINWGVMRISSDLRKQISPQEHFRRVSGIPCTNQALTRCIWLNFSASGHFHFTTSDGFESEDARFQRPVGHAHELETVPSSTVSGSTASPYLRAVSSSNCN